MVVDPLSALYSLLSTNVIVLANNISVYGPPGLPVDWTLSKAVVFSGGGGLADVDLPVYEDTIIFHCYGATPQEARFVHGVLYDVLHRHGRSDLMLSGHLVRFIYIRESVRPYDMVDPVTEYPYVLTQYHVKLLETFV